ncbi:thermonuclease family protein [Rhizobium ruizarguesonis]|nr:thermonuclease family protein [Rhizobium ruizarguesonis]
MERREHGVSCIVSCLRHGGDDVFRKDRDAIHARGVLGGSWIQLYGGDAITRDSAAAGAVAYQPYSLCSGAKHYHCVVDGDTIWNQGIKIRIADIDTPEVSEPKCASEAALGIRATHRMLQLLNAGPFEMRSWPGRDEDKYGRKLRVLVRNGRSLGDTLVSEGLARTWTGRRQPWC